ncbi:IclR family transcriptional regulator [Lacisediminimonas profundi]|uniref:IclR family transcriptional regulator n=1 Tax=Lacisediminimonas profundi TaxID=2603856 RepID=UPI00124AEBCD|nr:IclR family transcriptional regulator C-terminal domain-containing protein [Lacisediminimonas profundi]
MSKSPSVISRVTAILGLFGEGKPLISIDEISMTLGVSTATAYRYASDLMHAGMLSRTSGRYRLGPKIIELEYLIRAYDPIIRAGEDLMNTLAESTGCNALLCNVYDETIVNVFHATGKKPIPVIYTKGLPMPLFRGSQAHVVLAHMDRRKLKRLYDSSIGDPALRPDIDRIGADWTSFSRALRQIRSRGYYISRAELDQGVTGIAAPVIGEDQEILGSLVLIHHASAPPWMSEETLVELTIQNANEISKRIELLAAG